MKIKLKRSGYMGRTIKVSVNIDKLKVCLIQPEGLFERIYKHEQDYIVFNGFALKRIECDTDTIVCNVLLDEVGQTEQILLGHLTLNNTCKYGGKAFFEFENSALYTVEGIDASGNKYNKISYLYYVIETLGMELNNLTQLDLALDSNINFIKKIIKAIKNYETFDMYLNGKRIIDPNEKLPEYGVFHGASRKRLESLPTLYLSQVKKETGLSMRIYDKTKELAEQSLYKKERFLQWLGWTAPKIYRAEITMHNVNVRDFCTSAGAQVEEQGNLKNVLNLLGLKVWRAKCFMEMADRLIYFRNRKSRKKLTLIDLAEL